MLTSKCGSALRCSTSGCKYAVALHLTRHASGQKQRKKFVDNDISSSLPVHQYKSMKDRPDNRVYMWGYAELGALGIKRFLRPDKGKNPIKRMHRPVRVPFAELNHVCDVACGFGFTLLAVRRQEFHVFGTGLNTDCQVGLHDPNPGNPLERVIKPSPIRLPVDESDRFSVLRVAGGRAHSVVLTDTAGVFTLGNNAFGQCGRAVVDDEDYRNSSVVHRVPLDERIVDVVCGQDHTLLLSESGRVLSCGWGADGQTGRGHYNNCPDVGLVVGDIEGEKIVKVAGAADCVLALSDSGDVFGWGNSEYSQLSSATDEQQLSTARRLPLSVGRVVDVAASGSMCALINDRGDVYVWGFGPLGKGPKLDQAATPQLIPAPLFGRNEFNPDSVPVSVAAGLYHLAVVTSSGDLFTWGRNRNGALGLGHSEDRLFPLRVAIPARVKRVACGVDHMAALCREYL